MADTAALKGTHPEGAQTEADAARKVREMFTQIAPRYDLLNHLLSLQLDRLWRALSLRSRFNKTDKCQKLVGGWGTPRNFRIFSL